MERIARRKFLQYSGAATLASALLGKYASAVLGQSNTPPNILLITADDLGQQLGCYGDKTARTPKLDQLASQGIRFTNGYVTNASCSPSRSSLFTGLYPHQTGFFPPDNKPAGQIGLAYEGSGYAMDPSITTMPQKLKAAGYRTGLIGKLHVFPEASFPFDYYKSSKTTNTRNIELVAQLAEDFLAQQSQKPFFLAVCYADPHTPYLSQVNGYPKQPFGPKEVPPFPWQGIDTSAVRENMAGYYNGVARLDAGVGLLLSKLAQLGLDDNTMVIFVGDHGPGFIRAKVTCYEAGLCIPFLVRWPGRISSNRVNKSLVSTVDILPTMLQAAGVAVPKKLAGRSLMQLFKGNTTDQRGILCAEYTSHTREGFYPRRCIRGARYKYIFNLLPNQDAPVFVGRDPAYKESRKLPVGDPARVAMDRCRRPPKEELYDLVADPTEFNNLAGKSEYQDRLDFLRGELLKWRQRTKDPLLDPAVLAAMVQEH
jgi:N-sulfoglucosamine sulfohydrolase